MKHLPVIILLGAAQCTWAFSVEADSVADISRRSASDMSLAYRLKAPFYQASEADMYYERAYSLNDISATYVWRHEEEAEKPWNGDGISNGVFDARAYLRLGKKSIATAGAGYENGKVRGVRWNSTADYDVLYPYVVADSLGGDLQREQYHFYGGFASRAGKFVYGLGAKYRAIHQYRDYDPRPRNMATDLSVSVSGNMRVGDHVIGLGADVRFYKQVMDVAYYSQTGANSTQFHFTGLGHTYGRIDGVSYTETRHKGFGYGVSASFLPVARRGFMAEGTFEFLRMNRQIHEFNEAPLTTLHTYAALVRAGYQFSQGSVTHMAYAQAQWQRRRGFEAIVDNGYLGEFKIIGRHEKYHLNIFSSRAAWLISVDKGRWAIEVEPSIGFVAEKEDYVEPYSKVERLNVEPSLHLQAMLNSGKWLFAAGLNACGRIPVDKTFDITPKYIQTDLYAYEISRFDRANAPSCDLSPSVTLQRTLDSLGAVYGRVAYTERIHNYGPCRGLSISVGWRFF